MHVGYTHIHMYNGSLINSFIWTVIQLSSYVLVSINELLYIRPS